MSAQEMKPWLTLTYRLMLSTWMARMGIRMRIIDRRFNKINSG